MSPPEPTGAPAADVKLERLERLQWLTAALSAAVTPEQVAGAIFEQGVGATGAWGGNLFWESEPGQLDLVHAFGLAPEHAAALPGLVACGQSPSAEAWRTGQAVWLESAEAIRARYPEQAEKLAAMGDQAWVGLPLGLDRTRGALCLRFGAPRTFDAAEREFLLAMSHTAAQALERARLYAVQRSQTERLSALQASTAALSAALTPREVAAVVFRGLMRIGPRNGGLFLKTEDGHLDLVFAQGADPETQALLRHVPLGVSSPPTDSARTGRAIWLDTPEAIRAAYPRLEALRVRRGDVAWVALPLLVEARTIGSMAFTLPEGVRLAAEDRDLAVSLAQQAAQALERSRLFDVQHQLARRLASAHLAVATLSGVASAAVRAVEGLGAFALELWSLRGDRVERVAAEGDVCGGVASDGEASMLIDAPNPVAEVARVGRAVWCERPEVFTERWPHLEAGRARAGLAACALVPLLAGGRTLGVLAVGWDEARALAPEDRAHLRLVALPCAYALDRAMWRRPTPTPLPAVTATATVTAIVTAIAPAPATEPVR